MEELKPCPFCGATQKIKTKRLGSDTVFVINQLHYPDCFLRGFTEPENEGYTSSDALIRAWNRREYELERDELLDIADEMESFSDREYCAYGIDEPTCNKLSSFSDRIRRSLGME